TRELDALNPRHLVSRIDAILLTGGSAYGLGAADGVMRWLRERRRGLPLGPAGVVPIVPTAVIFDFDLGPGGKADRWPTADDAYRACDAASADVSEGTVGAGTGATVGKALGPGRARKGGVGTWATRRGTRSPAASCPTAPCSTATSSSPSAPSRPRPQRRSRRRRWRRWRCRWRWSARCGWRAGSGTCPDWPTAPSRDRASGARRRR